MLVPKPLKIFFSSGYNISQPHRQQANSNLRPQMNTPLQRISERVTRLGHPEDSKTPRPLLALHEFFEGNDVIGSIGCNLLEIPQPSHFYKLLLSFLARPEVKDIRVQITAFDDPDWPFSDTVYVVTTAAADEVASWFEENLAPDGTWEGFLERETYEPYTVPPGYRAIGCWWD
jgi:hypothetical protein